MREQVLSRRIFVTDIILIALSLLLTIGSFTFFRACPAHEDGTFMSCHWAQQTITGLGLVMLAMSVVHIITGSNSVKSGLSAGLICTSVFSALIPGIFINICKMDTMRCVMVTRPADMIISFVITGIAVIDLIVQTKKSKI